MKKLLAPLQVKVEEWKKNTSALEREHDKGQYHQTQTRNSCSHYISVIIQQNQTPHSVDYMYMYILHVHVCGLLVEEFPRIKWLHGTACSRHSFWSSEGLVHTSTVYGGSRQSGI